MNNLNTSEEIELANQLESLRASYAQHFESNPSALIEAEELMEGMTPKWQAHALTSCLEADEELSEFENELQYWREEVYTTDEELVRFKKKYFELFGERALMTANKLIEGMDKEAASFAWQYSTLHNKKFEDIEEHLTYWNWTFNITTTAFSTVMDRQKKFEEDLKRAANAAGIELSQRMRPLLGAVAQMEKTVQGLALAVSDIEQSSKKLSDTAYKDFKARVNPEELKRLVVDGAGARLSDKLLEAVQASVAKEFMLKRYQNNILVMAFFIGGLCVGKFFW